MTFSPPWFILSLSARKPGLPGGQPSSMAANLHDSHRVRLLSCMATVADCSHPTWQLSIWPPEAAGTRILTIQIKTAAENPRKAFSAVPEGGQNERLRHRSSPDHEILWFCPCAGSGKSPCENRQHLRAHRRQRRREVHFPEAPGRTHLPYGGSCGCSASSRNRNCAAAGDRWAP